MGWITDPTLLNRLAAEKLEREAESVRAQGWKWVEIMPDVAWDTLRSFDRIHPTPTKQQRAALDTLQAKLADMEPGEEAYDVLYAKLEKLESEIAFTAEQKAASGAIVTISAEGEREIFSGLVRREDRAAAKKKAEGDSDAANAPPCFSAKLIEDLTAHRTAALQAMVADNPKVALAAVVHGLALGVFYDGDGASILQIAPRVADLDRSAEGIGDTVAMKQLAAATKEMKKRLPKDGGKLWDWLRRQEQKNPARPARGLRRSHRRCRREARRRQQRRTRRPAACRRAQARYGGLLAADRGGVFQPRVERTDACRHRRGVRRRGQERLRHAQESGAG